MVLIALAAELADLATWAVQPLTGHYELNPLGTGPYALPLKALLMVVIAAGYLAYRARWRPVLVAAIVAGTLGAWSNLA